MIGQSFSIHKYPGQIEWDTVRSTKTSPVRCTTCPLINSCYLWMCITEKAEDHKQLMASAWLSTEPYKQSSNEWYPEVSRLSKNVMKVHTGTRVKFTEGKF